MNNETEQIFLLNPTENQPSTESQKPEEVQILPQDVEDFCTVCRTCATVTEFVIPIFDGEGLQNNFAEKIHKHLPIKVSETDVLPRVVCYQCASTLLAWHELVQCCVQADVALRTRLAVAAAGSVGEPKNSSKEIVQNLEQEQNKFKEIAEFVVQSLEPPRYSPPGARACAYCAAAPAAAAYDDHLLTAHADHLFHCDECDTYVDRKDFILHMSLHAGEYAAKQEKKAEPIKRVKKVKKRKSDAKDENENNEKSSRKCTRRVKSESDMKSNDGRKTTDSASDPQENEFSDHSDTEYGFGPLPESVFEAIEDSQDSQPTNDNEVSSTLIEIDEAQPNERSDTSAASIDSDRAPEPPEGPVKPHKKPRTCPICGKVYTASSSYFYHMKHFHRQSRDHECDVCGKKFGTKACLVQHRFIHTGERRYECKVCGKRFRTRASVYIHEQTHSGVKAWSCSVCQRSFRWRTQLARHAARHAAERRHACAACGRAFAVRADLLRHVRTHADTPPSPSSAAAALVCLHCGLRFAQPRYLKVHIHRKHAAESAKPANGL